MGGLPCFCPTCGNFMIRPDKHRCSPRWEIKYPDWLGDETKFVHAHDAGEAGERFARVTDSYGDYEFANGHEAEVQIRRAATDTEEPGPWETYILSAEPSVEYHARQK